MAAHTAPRLTYIGGPTALIEWRGLRLLTDPTLDPAGSTYVTSVYTLEKLAAPALAAEKLLPLDAVLLSHDHHFDNLDRAGRELLAQVPRTFTTTAGAARLGPASVGLEPWQETELTSHDGACLRITGTPARHGPGHADRGPVTGFVLAFDDTPGAIYVSGDTVWYPGVQAIADRFDIRTAILFLGAARVQAVGPDNLTFTAAEAVHAARAFAKADIVPLHFEGWAHFSESRADVTAAFAAAGLSNRLRWLEPGIATELS